MALTVGGCGPGPVCQQYVACQRAFDDRVSVEPYDEGGSCWTGFQTAQECTRQCQDVLDAIATTPDPPAACLDGSS